MNECMSDMYPADTKLASTRDPAKGLSSCKYNIVRLDAGVGTNGSECIHKMSNCLFAVKERVFDVIDP